MLDLSTVTGFHLLLDPASGQLHSNDGFRYRQVTRTFRELAPVLRSPDSLPDETPMYYTYYVSQQPPWAEEALSRDHLTYGPVVIPPGTINGEYVKTSGHYHPLIPGTRYAYPEVYTGLSGRLLLFLQKRDLSHPQTPEDCKLIELRAGVTVIIPPDYAHVLINPSNEIAVMAGLYSLDFKPDYTDVMRYRGLAYYILQGIDIVPNPHYVGAPPLQQLTELSGTAFAPLDDPAIPLWTHFMNHPEKYAFLSQAAAVEALFERSQR